MAKRKKCKGGICSLQNLPKNPTPRQQESAIKRLMSQTPPTQRRIITTQMGPINQQPNFQSLQVGQPIPQQYTQSPSLQQQIAPLQQQQDPSLQQTLSPLPQDNAQPFSANDNNINALLDKVNSGSDLQPQEAQALYQYVQQYLPQQQQQQQGQYNPQDYLQGPLTGFLQDNQAAQSQNVPYEQSPFFQYANQVQSNPNAPQALKKPGFFKRLWNGIKSIFNQSPAGAVAKAIKTGNPGYAIAGPATMAIDQAFNNGQQQQGYAATGSPGSVQAGQQGNPGDPYGLAGEQGRSQVLSPNGQQRGFWSGLAQGEHPEVYQISNLTPYQQKGSNYILDQALRGLQNNNPNFTPIANQQLEQFYTQTVPSLAERFTSMGGQRSSAFQGALANAGRFLRNDLAASQQQFNQQNLGHYTNLLNYGLQPRFENAVNPGTEGILPGAVKSAGNLAKAGISYGMMAV